MANENPKYRFTITYYYERDHTGYVDKSKTRTAVVTATNRKEAVQKVWQVDDNGISVASLKFEELDGE